MAAPQEVPAPEGVVQLEFTLAAADSPLVAASTAGDYQAVLDELVPRADGTVTEFVTVAGGPPEDVRAAVTETLDQSVQLLGSYDDGALFELRLPAPPPPVAVVDAGALPRRLTAVDGTGRLVAAVPSAVDPGAVVDAVLARHPGAELAARRQQPYQTPLFSHRQFADALEAHLSARQLEVLLAAYRAGFYEWPRDRSGVELAGDLDVSPSTFHQHLRTAERKLVGLALESSGLAEVAPPD
ncbi:bacterio-opsin activator domain-containing protein [Halobacteriales archaeon Cl-PHB]